MKLIQHDRTLKYNEQQNLNKSSQRAMKQLKTFGNFVKLCETLETCKKFDESLNLIIFYD